MHQQTAFDWNSYDFTGHLNDRVNLNDIADKASIRSQMFKTFLLHYERQDICEEHEHNPESHAIKSLLHSRLMSNKEWLPQSLNDDIDLIKNADEKTTNLLFQLMLVVEHEATVRRLAEDFTRHNPKLFSFTFKAIEKFYSDVSPVSLVLKEEDDVSNGEFIGFSNPTSPIVSDESESDQQAATRSVKLTRKRPQKKGSQGKDANSKSVSVRTPRVTKPRNILPRRRETPGRNCAKKPNLENESADESSSAESDDEVPSSYVKKDLLKKAIKSDKRGPPRVKCTFEGCSKMLHDQPWHIEEHMRWHAVGFVCDVCGKKFGNNDRLRKHKLIHSDDKEFKCDQCDRSFVELRQLEYHILTHTGERPFMCEQCGKRFMAKGALQGHMVAAHSDKNSSSWVKCTFEGCDKTLRNQATKIRIHMLTHTGEKSHKCDVCGRCFSLVNKLNIHMRLHTGETRHTCDYCGKKYANLKSWKEHTYTHTGEKPYKCKECGKAFARSGSVSNHIRLVHQGRKFPPKKPKQVDQQASSSQVPPSESANVQHLDHFSRMSYVQPWNK